MRLTLRTLLAYLDDIPLDPADAKALAAKIEESEFATALVHRIRSSTRRLRLGAPKVDGKGMGLDPNTVAEYLDNTLPQERTSDFERICLESDVHLAEVASCHQILALVVGSPAEVDPRLRKRIYALGSRAADPTLDGRPSDTPTDAKKSEEVSPELASAATEPSGTDQPTAAATVRVPTPQAVVPDYLKAARRPSWTPVLLTLALGIVLITAALMSLGRLDENHPILGPLFRSTAQADAPGNEFEATPADSGPLAEAPAAGAGSSTETDAGVANPPSANAEGSSDASASATSADAPSRDDRSTEAPKRTPSEGTTPSGGEAAPSAPPDTAPPAAAEPAQPAPTPPAPSVSQPEPQPGSSPPADQPKAGVEATRPPSVEPVAAPVDVGRYIASERRHVFARLDLRQRAWYRLPEREVLHADDVLLVLPSYRPQIALLNGIQCMVIGPSHVVLGAPDAEGVPFLSLDSAMLLLDTAGVAGTRLTLRTQAGNGLLTLSSPDATVAVEVTRRFPWGQDPATIVPVLECRLLATSGRVTWTPEGQDAIPLNGGQQLQWVEGVPPAVSEISTLPAWVQGSDLREIDLRASRELESLLDTTRPLILSLNEQAGHRQIEVAALAAACLCELGDFRPAIAAFRSERFHAYWRSLVDALQHAMVAYPQGAQAIRAVIDTQRPEDGALLYRLLQGFNNDQLAAGDDERLVEMLEHRSMDVRVLAFDNLRRITDRTYLYRPERDPASQRRSLQDWRTALGKGEIRWPAQK